MLKAAARRIPAADNVLLFKENVTAKVECADNLQFMRELADESMHLIVTSPPYNMGKSYETRRSQDVYLEAQAATIAEAVRLLHPNGSICWQVGHCIDDGEVFPLDILLYPLFAIHGLKLRNRIVWTFGHGLHCQRRFSGRHETILWFTKGEEYRFNLDPVRVPSKYPEKNISRDPKWDNCRVIHSARTLPTCGTFRTSKACVGRAGSAGY